jgi:hypothetical protein
MWWKYYVVVHENEKLRPGRTIPVLEGRGDKRQ